MEKIRLLGLTLLVMTSQAMTSPRAFAADGEPIAPLTVPPLTVAPQPVTDWLTLDGTVSAINQGTVAAQTSGRVSRMLVDVNDQVQAGQPLLEISGKEQFAAVTGAEARLARAQAQQVEAERQLARFQALIAKGVITRAQLDNAQATDRAARAEVNAADAALTQAREAYGYTRILAPYAGVVTKRLVELGETVAPGTPLLSGFSLDTLRVEVELPQSALTLAREPADVQVLLPDGKSVTPVKLTRFNYADSQSHAFRLRLDLPPQTAGVLPGMWLKVQLKQDERQVLQVPDRALLRQGEFNGVYLQQPAGWALTPVRVGHCVEGQCEILAGLQAGDKLAPDAWAQQQEVAHE
ncbi:efflux RND transporter periplasmic adaptor subunit [Aeromonas veronii]|uniref:Efflux transporter, RND family, MFP subunit n=1 Tax=Aeromonas veronii AMC34 TaxID=1073383 RepID=K1IPW4_AERVE|nr:efflux RND transporter periplasmic adaptor subunit [Aeromonas veronii]EKB20216.1 efflux transporter, RND family, MFP subunit [Aeromonas veronii AMC34]MBA2081075.1 efflux transporter periplasmic adaptor subunit [Aeromonas veronii]